MMSERGGDVVCWGLSSPPAPADADDLGRRGMDGDNDDDAEDIDEVDEDDDADAINRSTVCRTLKPSSIPHSHLLRITGPKSTGLPSAMSGLVPMIMELRGSVMLGRMVG